MSEAFNLLSFICSFLVYFPNLFDCYLNAIQNTALKLLLISMGKKQKDDAVRVLLYLLSY